MKRTLEDVLALCREREIRIVDFKMSDMEGRWRHLSIPVERFDENLMRYGVGFDGSNYGYAPVEASDMVFVPDLDTAAVDPFSAVPTLNLLGDVMAIAQPENHPFDQYPRNVAKRAMAHMRQSGVADEMLLGPEYEFYVFDAVHFANEPHSAGYSIEASQAGWGPSQSAYRAPRKAGYHIDRPVDVNQDLRNEICTLLADWGVDVKYHHTEVGGCGQLEIEVEPGDMVKMADATMIVKYLVKNAALRTGKTATFLPKPVRGEAGSGMHVHMQLFRNGRPVFYDEKGYVQLSDTALWFIGGLLRHAPSLCALTNPSTNSYKRLVPGFEAPVTIGYATSNRSAVVRIPAYAKAPEHKRFELRNPDATCNPYYAFAAILMAGLDGVAKHIDPHERGWGPYDCNLYALSAAQKAKIGSLPGSLREALAALEDDYAYLTAGGVFSRTLLELWVKEKHAQLEEIESAPHPAEFARYYDL